MTGEIIVVRSGAYTGDSAIVPSDLEGMVAGYEAAIRALLDLLDGSANVILGHFVIDASVRLSLVADFDHVVRPRNSPDFRLALVIAPIRWMLQGGYVVQIQHRSR
jgi:hypothetical protein